MSRHLFAVLLCATAPLAAVAQAPSTEDIRAAIDRGQYQEAVKMVSQAQRLRGDAAKGYGRYELLMLKGDALLAAGSGAYAAHAYEDAMQAARERDKRAAARASALLARRVDRGEARPAAGGGANDKPLSPEARKQAMREMYDSLRKSVEPKVRDAAAGKTLPPMYDLLPALTDLGALELTADGSLEKTLPLLKQLGQRARELIGDELKRMDAEVARLESEAGEVEIITGRGFVGRRGLHTNDRKALEEARTYLERIEAVTRDGRRIAEMVGEPEAVENWEDLGVAASDAQARVESVLGRRY